MPGKIEDSTENPEEKVVQSRKHERDVLLHDIMKTKLDFYKNAMIKLVEITSTNHGIKWDSLLEVMFDGLYDDIIEFHEISVSTKALLSLVSDPIGVASKSP